jgi:IS4 transposase
MLQSRLDMAERRIADAKMRILRQEGIIERLAFRYQDTGRAENLLRVLEQSLLQMTRHKIMIEDELRG